MITYKEAARLQIVRIPRLPYHLHLGYERRAQLLVLLRLDVLLLLVLRSASQLRSAQLRLAQL